MTTTFDRDEMIQKIADRLLEEKKSIVTVESCTGGGIAFSLTDFPGSSNWFDRAYVTYSNEAKQQMVGVNEQTIIDFGAVSESVAGEMAMGGLKQSQVDFSLSVTGVAGPGGGSPAKPVGMVCFGWAVRDERGNEIFTTETRYFKGDRQSVRSQTIFYSLSFFLENFLC
ncbi:MAG: nicotinamide-nucleotide amidohydrolase family protein [Gammaproteobacteria bacterium]|nr:nicotinamide-nucleotide amidohydrolase family protein [Gammaproteobacteria bacterium]